MQRIDMKQKVGQAEYWNFTNTNTKEHGMIHPFPIHGTHFTVVSRNGHEPFPNEYGYKDTIPVRPGETVRLRVEFPLLGVFMYHCHIIEHEDAGMMAQIEIFDPDHPKKYHLMDMDRPLLKKEVLSQRMFGCLVWILKIVVVMQRRGLVKNDDE